MVIVGVDPGLSGSIAKILANGDLLEVIDMPVYQYKKGKGYRAEYDLIGIARQVEDICACEDFVFLERTQSLPPGMRVQASYRLGFCEGVFRGIFVVKRIRCELVRPREWQKHFGISALKGDLKGQSYRIASELFPKAELVTPKGRKLDGRSDALLIAEWGRRRLGSLERRPCITG